MTRTLLYIAILTVTLLAGCKSSHHDEPRPRPTIDTDELSMYVGETAEVHVSDADDLSAEASTSVVAVTADAGRGVIAVEALREGLATITVRADGAIMHCYVKVSAASEPDPDNPAPEEPTDEREQLADATPRYVSTTLTMRHDTPGTIVMRYADGTRYAIRSLLTGDYISFDAGTPSRAATLSVNGDDVELTDAQVADTHDGMTWYRLLTARWRHTVWIVVPDA